MKAYYTGQIRTVDGVDRVHLIIELTDPELMQEAFEKKCLTLHTEKEFNDLRSRLSAIEKQMDRLTTGNVGHVRGTVKMIVGGVK